MLNRLLKIAAAAVAFMGAVSTPAAAQSRLGSMGGQGPQSLCMRPINGDGSNGVQLTQVFCNSNDPSFIWSFKGPSISSGGFTYYHVFNSGTQKCLDATNGSTVDRTPVQQYECNSSTTEYWTQGRQNGSGVMLINLRTGKCLDAQTSYPSAGATVILYHCASVLSGTTTPNLAQFWLWF